MYKKSNVVNFIPKEVPKDARREDLRVDMRLLLAEWGFHIFSSSLGFMMMSVTLLMAIMVLTDVATNSSLTIQIIDAIFSNPVAFAIVWCAIFLAILGSTAVKTVEDQMDNYRTFEPKQRRNKRRRRTH